MCGFHDNFYMRPTSFPWKKYFADGIITWLVCFGRLFLLVEHQHAVVLWPRSPQIESLPLETDHRFECRGIPFVNYYTEWETAYHCCFFAPFQVFFLVFGVSLMFGCFWMQPVACFYLLVQKGLVYPRRKASRTGCWMLSFETPLGWWYSPWGSNSWRNNMAQEFFFHITR